MYFVLLFSNYVVVISIIVAFESGSGVHGRRNHKDW